MEKATISQIKNRLSAYLDKVRAGETVVVLDRDRPVARIERIEPAEEGDERLARLERQGLVRRGSESLPAALLQTPGPRSASSVVEALIEERREAR
jgi:prevent-host-death family protein